MLVLQNRRRVRKDGSWANREKDADGNLPDGTWRNDERTCALPLLPVVFDLNTRASDAATQMARNAAMAAAFGVCWPDGEWPSLSSCGYDSLLFGNGVLDHAYRNDWDAQLMLDEGGRALNAMTDDLLAAINPAGPAAGFTPAPGHHGTP